MKFLLSLFYTFTGLFVLSLADGTIAMRGHAGVSGFLGCALAFSIIGLLGSALAIICAVYGGYDD